MLSEILVSMGAALVSGLGSSIAGFGISKYANTHFNPENPEDDDQVKKANRKKTTFTIIGSSLATAAISTSVGIATNAIISNYNSSEDNTDAGSDDSTSTDTSNGDVSNTDTSELR